MHVGGIKNDRRLRRNESVKEHALSIRVPLRKLNIATSNLRAVSLRERPWHQFRDGGGLLQPTCRGPLHMVSLAVQRVSGRLERLDQRVDGGVCTSNVSKKTSFSRLMSAALKCRSNTDDCAMV